MLHSSLFLHYIFSAESLQHPKQRRKKNQEKKSNNFIYSIISKKRKASSVLFPFFLPCHVNVLCFCLVAVIIITKPPSCLYYLSMLHLCSSERQKEKKEERLPSIAIALMTADDKFNEKESFIIPNPLFFAFILYGSFLFCFVYLDSDSLSKGSKGGMRIFSTGHSRNGRCRLDETSRRIHHARLLKREEDGRASAGLATRLPAHCDLPIECGRGVP